MLQYTLPHWLKLCKIGIDPLISYAIGSSWVETGDMWGLTYEVLQQVSENKNIVPYDITDTSCMLVAPEFLLAS